MKRLSGLALRILDVQSTWLVTLMTLVWLAATTWTRPLILPDEGRYVGVAWSMLRLGDWWVPRLDGLPFFHKPPLFYWITALSMQVFGVNEWAARMSSVLSATFIVGLAFWFLKKQMGQRVAIFAALILATQPFLFGAAQYANLDMTVAAMISATVILAAQALFRAERGESYRALLALAYGFAALGFLSKGLIGIVLPGGIIFFWLVGRRRFDLLRRLFYWPAIGVFLALSLPWMIVMQWRYPGFFDYYIIYQHFERFLESGFNNPHPFWFYVPVVLVLTLPWSMQLWRLARRAYWANPAHGALRGLMVSWLLVVLIFFSLPSSKLVGYVLPLLIPMAFFLAEPFAARLQGENSGRALKTYTWYLAISLAICLVAVIALVVAPLPSSKPLARAMSAAFTPTDRIVMLGRYRYDLDFYLRTGQPAWVVSNWDDPSVKTQDTWRKELYDASLFEPEAAARTLIEPKIFMARLCEVRPQAWWLLGDNETVSEFPWVAGMAVYARYGKLRVWRVAPGPAPSFCAEMPKNGPK